MTDDIIQHHFYLGPYNRKGPAFSFHLISLGLVMARVGIFSGSRKIMITEITVTAGNGEGKNDAIAAFEVLHSRACFFHYSHEFVPHYQVFHLWEEAIIDMEIRSANGGAGHFEDQVGGLFDHRICHRVNADIAIFPRNSTSDQGDSSISVMVT